MTIKTYPADVAGQAAAFATPDPRNIVYEGGKYVVRTGADYEAPQVEVPVVSTRAFRLALSQMGWRQEVAEFLKTAPIEVVDSFETAPRVARNDPMVLGAIAGLRKTEAQADELFAVAQAIEATL